MYKPNIGRQSQLETLDSLCRKFHRVGKDLPTYPLMASGNAWGAPESLPLLTCRLVSPGNCGRGPGTLGEQLCPFPGALQPHHLVRPGRETTRRAELGAQCLGALWAGKAHAAS